LLEGEGSARSSFEGGFPGLARAKAGDAHRTPVGQRPGGGGAAAAVRRGRSERHSRLRAAGELAVPWRTAADQPQVDFPSQGDQGEVGTPLRFQVAEPEALQ
jgi:hypothetical protein